MYGESWVWSTCGGTKVLCFCLFVCEPCVCDPVGRELCRGCVIAAETRVEAHSRSDVQFDGMSSV